MMLTPLQLISVHNILSCDGCARDAEEERMRREFGRKNVTQERLSVICAFPSREKFKPPLIVSRMK